MTHEERALALCAKMGWHFEDGSPHKGTLASLATQFAEVSAAWAVENENLRDRLDDAGDCLAERDAHIAKLEAVVDCVRDGIRTRPRQEWIAADIDMESALVALEGS